MRDPSRTRALERAAVLTAALIAAATIYAMTGNAGLAVGIAVLATAIALVIIALENLADRAVGFAIRLLTLPLRVLRRMLGA